MIYLLAYAMFSAALAAPFAYQADKDKDLQVPSFFVGLSIFLLWPLIFTIIGFEVLFNKMRQR